MLLLPIDSNARIDINNMDLNSFSADGFTIESNHEVPEDVRAQIAPAVKESKHASETGEPSKDEPRVIRPIPPEKEITRQHVDSSGKEHDEQGKFKARGSGKPDGAEALGDDAGAPPEKPQKEPAKAAEPDEAEESEKPSKAEKRIRKLVEDRNELERLLAAERRDRERLLAEHQAKQPAQSSEPEIDPNEPQEEDFSDHKSYTKALAKYEAKKLFEETQREQSAQRYAEMIVKLRNDFRETVQRAGGDEFLDTLPEEIKNLRPHYDMGEGEKPGPLNFLASEILHSGDRGIELMKYLAANPTVFRRFSTPLLPHEYGKLMGRIEAALDAATAGTPAQEPSKPKAPPFEPKGSPPIRPVSGGPHNVDSDDDLDDLVSRGAISFDEYNKRANARERAKRHA